MTFYLVGGAGASPTPTVSVEHLPSLRTRRYPSDTTDAEWPLIAPLIPVGHPGSRGGRRPVHSRRDIVDAIRYLAHNGCVWRALPADFPPWQTVYDYHARWATDGTVNHLHNALRDQARAAAGRDREPTAAIIDSQSVRAAETVARTSRGYDAGKKVNGRKRHIAVDTIGMLLVVAPTAFRNVLDRWSIGSLAGEPRPVFERLISELATGLGNPSQRARTAQGPTTVVTTTLSPDEVARLLPAAEAG